MRDTIKNVFITGDARLNWTHLTKDGEQFPAEVTIIRIPRGEDYILASYIRDLRGQKAAQEAADRYAKAKNEFLASVSHEIRTPLNAITAMAHIAGESGGLNENHQNIISQGMRSVKLLTSVIETILDFSRLDSGNLYLETVEFSIQELIDDISNMVRNNVMEKSLSFSASVDPGVPEKVLGDFTRLQQALLNIVINAIKFTETGSVEIHVSGKQNQQENVHAAGTVSLIFEVRDTGIGITEEQRHELFKPLFTGDASYTRKYDGMGMGLPVSNGLIQLMGGEITCESTPGQGSTFRIIITLAVPENKTAKTETIQETTDAEILRGMRVLVAEDNDINQMIIE
jgi:signal transduction histidine kinase